MKAMLLKQIMPVTEFSQALVMEELPNPVPGANEILIRVNDCGVCHTELDEIEDRLTPKHLPIVLGHQVVGSVIAIGDQVTMHKPGDRVGVGWIDSACGHCRYCIEGKENLCAEFRATGFDSHGGYAELMRIDQHFAYALPETLTDIQTAPLLCSGAIGYRSLRLTRLQNGERLGLTGFGASAHLVLQMAQQLFPDSPVYIFARNPEQRGFALELGADWVGDTQDTPPARLDAIIDTTPAWMPIVAALKRLAPAGRLIINAIRKDNSDQQALLDIDYPEHLWQEKEIKSVANVARSDVQEFLLLAAKLNVQPQVECYPLAEANRALCDLKYEHMRGAKVLRVNESKTFN